MKSALRWPRLIGHRGAALWAPENTLASFFCAAELGVSWIEFDVRLSADGVPMVFHDDLLDRTTDGHGPVGSQSLLELKRLDAGSWFGPAFAGERIPTLQEALATAAKLGLGVNIEIKPDPGQGVRTAKAAMEAARGLWPASLPAPLISSFDDAALGEAAQAAPEWPLGFLTERFEPRLLAAASRLGVASFNLNAAFATPECIAQIHGAGMVILAYTVNDPVQARRLWGMGIDGLFTDDPKSVRFS